MKNSEPTSYFPILLDLKKFSCLVIGGGSVGLRKVMNLIEFNLSGITVISPKFEEPFFDLEKDGKVKLIKREYRIGDSADFKLVFSATGNESADKLILEDCRKSGALLNIADIPEKCNFIMPATIKRGDFTASFSTQGKAPFFTKEKKEQFERILSPMVADVAELASQFRSRLMEDERYSNPVKRYALFHDFLRIDWEIIFYKEGKAGAFSKMEELFQ